MVTPQRPHSRPLAWEDDLSRNTLDREPFLNAPPISEACAAEVQSVAEKVIRAELLAGVSLSQLMARDVFPIPAADDREGYVPESDIGFWVSGLHDYLRVRHVQRRLNCEPNHFFEMGCASGRALRHFAAQCPQWRLWACEINNRHVRWVCDHLRPDIRCFHGPVLPHLPIADNQIDWTCAFSVFSHLDTFETAWIAELFRITRPEGFAYITFQTETTWDNIRRAPPSDRRRALIERLGDEVAEQLKSDLPAGRTVLRRTQQGPYRGLVFQRTDDILGAWGRYFQVMEVLPKYHGIDQTVVVFRKSSN